MSDQWKSITRMHSLSTLVAFTVGSYGCVLLFGTLYLNGMEQVNEIGSSPSFSQGGGLDPIIARGMKSKLSFTMFPGVVMVFLSLVIRMARPDISFTARHEDHATMSKIQGQCDKLVQRVNLTRLMTNVFAVVSVLCMCMIILRTGWLMPFFLHALLPFSPTHPFFSSSLTPHLAHDLENVHLPS